MKLLRNLLWPVLLPLIAAATAHAIVIFGTPIDKAKGPPISSNLGSSNVLDFKATVYQGSNNITCVGLEWTLPTNCPASWTLQKQGAYASTNGIDFFPWANYGYDYLYPSGISIPTTPTAYWFIPSYYHHGGPGNPYYTNYWQPMWITIYAKMFDSNGTNVYELWYPTNVIGQPEVYPTNFVKSFGGAGVDGGSSVAVDTNGNTYVAGYFSGTASILGTNLTATGAQNMFLAKVNQNGALQWAKRYGLGSESPVQMVINHAGELCVVGSCNGATDVSGATTTNGVNYLTNGALWVAKYNTSGVLQWSHSYQATIVGGIAVDSADNIYVVGVVGGGGGVNLGGATWYPAGLDTYLLKLNTSGTYVWDKEANCTSDTIAGFVSIDSNDDVFITGGFKGSLNWGSGSTNATYALAYALYLSKLNTSGTCAWTDVFGDGYYGLSPAAIASDNARNVYVGGRFFTSCNFGLGALSSYNNYGYSPFLCKYNSSGTAQWTTALMGPNPSYSPPSITALAIDSNTNIWAAGTFTSWMTIGTNTVNSLGGQDIFVARFDGGGTNNWSYSGGGPLYTYASGSGVAVDTSGYMSLVGTYYQTATFGSTTLNSLGGYDGFVLRQHP